MYESLYLIETYIYLKLPMLVAGKIQREKTGGNIEKYSTDLNIFNNPRWDLLFVL